MIKMSKGLEENGIFVGNTYDKYSSKNIIVRLFMKKFSVALSELVQKTNALTIHEVGCGEGFWIMSWNGNGVQARGSDFSKKVIDIARKNAKNNGLSENLFSVRSIYDIKPERDSADLIVCCEVLEHLKDPSKGLAALKNTATKYVILSVPREPIWRALNLARGKYIRSFGNTPGHIQHWSKKAFVQLVDKYFKIIEIRSPLPWTMVLCSVRP